MVLLGQYKALLVGTWLYLVRVESVVAALVVTWFHRYMAVLVATWWYWVSIWVAHRMPYFSVLGILGN